VFEKVCYGILTVSAVVMAFVVVTSSVDEHDLRLTALGTGEHAPDLDIELFDGEVVNAVDEATAERTLLVFFATDCAYCVASLPVYRELASRDCTLRIAVVVLDRRGQDLRDWWLTNAWKSGETCANVTIGSPVQGIENYGVRVTPTHILVDDAVIVEQHIGALETVPEWVERRP